MKKHILIFIFFFVLFGAISKPNALFAQEKAWSVRMADAFMTWHKDSILIGERKTTRWDYEQGLMLEALKRVWIRTGERKYYSYIINDLDLFVREDGTIRTYELDNFNIDNITTGRALLFAYQETGKEKYKKAAYLIRKQLAEHPRTKENGFWHKKIYPNQMWLDGLYMAQPFYTEFSVTFDEPQNFDDIAKQFELIESHLIDKKTGLLYHGYDESKQQKWANPQTGTSPNFWGRAMGWYAMALVDVLDNFPQNHPKYKNLIQYLNRLISALVRYQDKESGCWYQITDKGGEKGNYLEASATCMYVYAIAKGVRMGYLPANMSQVVKKGYEGILKNFIEIDENGFPHLNKTVSVGGLGGNPYRDGSYEYYLSEPIRKDDLKGIGPFIKASIEMEIAEEQVVGKGKKVVLDYFFNNEYRKNKEGKTERYHYVWEDKTNSGFWHWGEIFRNYGAEVSSLSVAPTAANLKKTDIYIIVDPDTKKETEKPNFIESHHIKTIGTWVQGGGILVVMANDTGNVELRNFNRLVEVFGLRFIEKNRNMVKNNQFEQGKIEVTESNPIFKTGKTLYLKEIVTLEVREPAYAVVKDNGDIIMAVSDYGKGKVFAVVDPWLYNEYVNGKKLPAEYKNFEAMKELTVWLLQQKK
ncbi:glycoside hydrolase family 88/105 protein [Thermoflexibacter ruber]|uniref:Unsaturated rhamnogalacturonyl hydrolase n=1 Tax=Thermoflexibacter ruber TaxID=1003 RepID=A0A1I2EAI4_9BACT|nr:glycoside hydrolase family 88 protein [Thermoflexibacter ruber]SFE89606.1 unsaturated rhamnogalacturonyl hydrolase [Thermoflexibacter ruber]